MPIKQVAICGGGDWNDASVYLLSVPVELNLKKANEEYKEWLRKGNKYKTFADWLKEFKQAGESSVEEFWEDLW